MTSPARHICVSIWLLGTLALTVTSCTDPPQLTQPPRQALVPSNLVAVSPTSVTAVVGMAVRDAPAVRVTDQNGSPVSGVPVVFTAAQGAGTLTTSAVLTDREGVASSGGWTIGQSAGRHAIFARSTALPGASVTFESTGIARGLQRISRYAGDRQIADAATPARFPLSAIASDTFGNPIAGIPISFAVVSGGGTIDETPVTTNANGVSTSRLMTLGAVLGDQQVEASTAALRTTFTVFSRQARSSCVILNCPGSKLAFVRNGDIYAASADGSNPIRLARGIEPAWSADGRIAFTGADGVYVMNEDGSSVRLVAPGGSAPAWSPAEQRLALVRRTADGQAIDVVSVDAATATPVRIGFGQGWNAWPSWSPDGSLIAFVADATAYDFAWEVFVVDRDGTGGNLVTNGFFGSIATWPSYFRYTQPAWSPDGAKMALMQCPAWQYTICDVSNLVVMNADGTGIVRLGATRGYVRPSWSPNSKWITFDGPSGIRFISADGLEQGSLIPNASSATWRP